jgi:hypothetical protein
LLDAVLSVGPSPPVRPGDWTVCFACTGLLVFGEDRRPAAPTGAQFVAMVREDSEAAFTLLHYQAAARRALQQHGPRADPRTSQ